MSDDHGDLSSLYQILQFYLEISQYPLLLRDIRKQMRQELFAQKIISENEFEKQVYQKVIELHRVYLTEDSHFQVSPADWEKWVGNIRSNLTDFYFSHSMPITLFEEITSKALSENSVDLAKPKTFFVSYSRNDWEEYAEPIVERLRNEGFVVWVDQHLLEGGDNWLDEINKALAECEYMVLCVSPDALESKYVKLEYRSFFHDAKDIIPVICRKVERLPAELRGLQHIPFDFDKLIEQVKKIVK